MCIVGRGAASLVTRSHTHTQKHKCISPFHGDIHRPQSSAALLLVVRHTAHDGAQLRVGEASTSNVGAGPGAPAAYCHFRFDIEFGEAVLYLYEMHVEPEWQGTGLGRLTNYSIYDLRSVFSNHILRHLRPGELKVGRGPARVCR